jgi:hypothetical protein
MFYESLSVHAVIVVLKVFPSKWGSSELSACNILLMLHLSTGAGEVAEEARSSTHVTITRQVVLYLRLPL